MEISLHKEIADEASASDYFELLKPKVMRLVVFTAIVGLLAAPITVHPVIAFASILCVAIGAGASGALNMWWDADIDGIMKRTASRPIPSGRVDAKTALSIGIALSFFSVMMLAVFANYFAAFLLASTILFYILVYSMWLKRRTPQNIVIGGAAGAFPPLIGWSIATGNIGVESILMFLLIFVWTPPHFWTLAIFVKNDYDNAKVPMLTVTHGIRKTRFNILVYTFILAAVSLSIAFTNIGGPFYFVIALALNGYFMVGSLKIFLRPDNNKFKDNFKIEKHIFLFSIFYLFTHFTAILFEAILRLFDLSVYGWPILI